MALGGGIVMPPAFAVVLISLTIAQHAFLRQSGWSAVHRTPVEWPSILVLGPGGGVLVAAFIVAGLLVLGCGAALMASATDRSDQAAGIFLVAGGIALALESFKPDQPGAATASWHDQVHGAAYPLIPFATIAAAAVLAQGLRHAAHRRRSRWSAAALVVFVVALIGTSLDPIAQLARYFLFGEMLVWLELVALDLLRCGPIRSASDCSCSTS